MTFRALIIGIEQYPDVRDGSIAKSLPETSKSASDFRDWLLAKLMAEGVNAADTHLLLQPVARGLNRGDLGGHPDRDSRDQEQGPERHGGILLLLQRTRLFIRRGRNPFRHAVASDFKSTTLSGGACLNLDKTIYWIRQHLGPGRHYYFVDACRNVLDETQIRPGGLLLPSNPQSSEEASTYVLQSANQGGVAAADGVFSDVLVSGLRGKGSAKTWDDRYDDAMVVRYDSLRKHMQDALKPREIYGTFAGVQGPEDAIFTTLRPVPTATCTVELDDAIAGAGGTIVCVGRRNATPLRTPVAGKSTGVRLTPDWYRVSFESAGTGSVAAGPVNVEMYDDTKLRLPVAGPAGQANLNEIADGPLTEIVLPIGTSIELRDAASGTSTEFSGSVQRRIPKGRYSAVFRDDRARVVKRTDINIGDGNAVVDIGNWRASAPHVSIADKFPPDPRGVDFSESLGAPVSDPDLDLWLAIIGGGRILGSAPFVDYSKIAKLPLVDFSEEAPGSSPIYVLAAFEDVATRFDVGLSQAAEASWTTAKEPDGMPGIRHCLLRPPAGQQLISFRINGRAPYRVASLRSENRAKLVTVTLDQDNSQRISQYLLPIGKLLPELNQDVRARIERRNQLSDVRLLAQSARAFRRRRDVWKTVSDYALNDVLDSKWVDPIASALAAYELLRRGRSDLISVVVQNMITYFPELPDTRALAVLAGRLPVEYGGVPFFLDGLRAFPGIEQILPLPASKLDYNSPWTAWRGAVK